MRVFYIYFYTTGWKLHLRWRDTAYCWGKFLHPYRVWVCEAIDLNRTKAKDGFVTYGGIAPRYLALQSWNGSIRWRSGFMWGIEGHAVLFPLHQEFLHYRGPPKTCTRWLETKSYNWNLASRTLYPANRPFTRQVEGRKGWPTCWVSISQAIMHCIISTQNKSWSCLRSGIHPRGNETFCGLPRWVWEWLSQFSCAVGSSKSWTACSGLRLFKCYSGPG